MGRLHFEQIRMGGLSFAAQTIANVPGGVGHDRRMLREVHLGATTGVYRKLAGSLARRGRCIRVDEVGVA